MDKCPMCGYQEPSTNVFNPNIMTRYRNVLSGVAAVFNHTADKFTSDDGQEWIKAELYTPASKLEDRQRQLTYDEVQKLQQKQTTTTVVEPSTSVKPTTQIVPK